MCVAERTPRNRQGFSWQQLRLAVAVLLLAAAATKVVNTAHILAGGGLLGTVPRLLFVIAFEATAAVWLVIGNLYWSWILTLVTFSVFVASTSYAILTGQSCNCFGDRLSPQVMLMVDAVVLVLAGCFRPCERIAWAKRHTSLLACAIAVGVTFGGASMWRNQTVDRSEPLDFLLADMLIDKSWPLNEQVHPDLKELTSGKWFVLVVREDCDHCRQMVAQHFNDPQTHRPNERTAVFIAGSNEWGFALDEVSLDISEDELINWPTGEPFVASPAVFLVENGIVVDAADGNDSEHFIEAAFANASGS